MRVGLQAFVARLGTARLSIPCRSKSCWRCGVCASTISGCLGRLELQPSDCEPCNLELQKPLVARNLINPYNKPNHMSCGVSPFSTSWICREGSELTLGLQVRCRTADFSRMMTACWYTRRIAQDWDGSELKLGLQVDDLYCKCRDDGWCTRTRNCLALLYLLLRLPPLWEGPCKS